MGRSGLVIEQSENGVVGDDSLNNDPLEIGEDLPLERYTSNWYISYNLFEMINVTTPAISFTAPGCTEKCFLNMHLLQNTIYLRPKEGSFPDLLSINTGANLFQNASILNNVFYSTNGSAASGTAIVRLANIASDLKMAGNVYAKNVDSYALLNYAGQPFLTLESLRTGMFERAAAGYLVDVPSSIAQRLIDLNPPSDFVDPVQGDPEIGSVPNAQGDVINGIGLAWTSERVPLDPILNAPGHERALESTYDIPEDFTEAYNYRDFSPALGLAIDLTEFFDPDDIDAFGEYDLVQRFIFDLTRPNAFDSGAFRYLTKADFSGSQTFEDGQYAWAQWEIEDDTELVFQTENSLGNFTVERAFNVPSNASVTVGSNGRLLVREGNATASGTLVAGFNSTLNYFGNLKLAENGTLSIDEAFNVTLRRFEQEAGAKIRFKEGTTAFRVLKGITLNGEIDIVITTPPSEKRITATVAVASYPPGTSTGVITRANAVIGYPGGECDQYLLEPDFGASTLSVGLTSLGQAPGCIPQTAGTTQATQATSPSTKATTATSTLTTPATTTPAGPPLCTTHRVQLLSSNSFAPQQMAVRRGDVIEFDWVGGTHNVVQVADENVCNPLEGGFSSGAPASTTGVQYTLQVVQPEGIYHYICQPHCSLGMRGFFAVAGTCSGRSSGDSNFDGVVNLIDILGLIEFWGPCDPSNAECVAVDFNADGIINLQDLIVIFNRWSK